MTPGTIVSESLQPPGPPSPITMPSAEELAVETISRILASSYVSSICQLPRPILNEVARRYAEGVPEIETLVWIGDQGHTVTKSSLNRFAQRLREQYKIVWSEWANRLLIAEMSADPSFDVAQLQTVIKNRVTTLVAQEVMTSSPQELDTNRLSAVLGMVAAADKGKIEREKLLLAQATAESRAIKSDAEVDKLRQAMRLEEARVAERVKALESRFDELSTTVQRGRQVDPSIFAAIRAELTGLAPAPGREAA